MPEGRRIQLMIEGLESDQGHVRLPDFVQWLHVQHNTLADFDKLVSGDSGTRSNFFRIVALSQESPAQVTLQVLPKEPDNDLSQALVERYLGAIKSISEGDVPSISVSLLENLRQLAAPIGTKIRSASIAGDGVVVDISESFGQKIEQALKEVSRSSGSIEGKIERFNAHAGANEFFVYPAIGASRVRCRFSENLKEEAAAAILREVRITGELLYFRDESFPHEVRVEKIEVYEPEEQLPTLGSLKGLAPDATGDLSSEHFLREERDAWED